MPLASEIPAAGVPAAAALARRAWHDGVLYHLLLDSEETAQQAKGILEQAGGRMRMLLPHYESLEEYFVRVTGTEAAQVEKRKEPGS